VTFGLLRAVAAGYALACGLTLVGVQLAQRLFPVAPDVSPPTGFLAIAIGACFLSSVVAAYTGARLAPAGKTFASLAFLVLAFASTAVAIARLTPGLINPPVVLPLTTMLTVIGALSGAMIERAIYGSRTSRGPSARAS
jgi:hypothetical protein